MTRAQQTISIGLLVSSVRRAPDKLSWGDTYSSVQLYLVCFLQLIPFTTKIQDEIIPIVSAIGPQVHWSAG